MQMRARPGLGQGGSVSHQGIPGSHKFLPSPDWPDAFDARAWTETSRSSMNPYNAVTFRRKPSI